MTKIPNHSDLEMFAILEKNVPCVAFRKNGKEVYLHVFCNSFIDPTRKAIQMVIKLYIQFNLGKPAFAPHEPNWIHTIPIPGVPVSEAEKLLIHQITHSLFWTIYMDFKQRQKNQSTSQTD